jgi:hypothetical protein
MRVRFGYLIHFALPVFLFFIHAGEAGSQTSVKEVVVKLKLPEREKAAKIAAGSFFRRIAAEFPAVDIRPLIPEELQSRLLQRTGENPAAGVFIFRTDSVEVDRIVTRISSMVGVVYARPIRALKVDQLADSLAEKQWGLEAIRAAEAWKITTGSPDVPVVLIDTGIDYEHEALRNQLWVNPGEDLNGNGRADRADFNGVDDDGNGLVDDIWGYDFVDAPNYPDDGDYLERDSDPFDEHGHGTAVAGIMVGASARLVGVAPGTRVVNLRAGTSQGLLEEDDVAAAIRYAVAMGFRVINMSFGDVMITPLLRDVISFAYRQGVVLVASSGNSGDDQLHYPSSLQETISVGAAAEGKYRAPFSTFGSTLDLLAPGVGIWTAELGGDYREVSGTSAAAPFVSAGVALLLARRPELSPESVRNRLVESAEDLENPGWDFETGAGLLRLDRLLEPVGPGWVKIEYPVQDQVFRKGTVPVVATCAGALLESFRLDLGLGAAPEKWTELAAMDERQVISETLAVWIPPAEVDTIFTLRLQGILRNGVIVEDRVTFRWRLQQVSLREWAFRRMWWKDRRVGLLETLFSEPVAAVLFWREQDSGPFFEPLSYGFENRKHHFFVDPGRDVALEMFLEVRTRGGEKLRIPADTLLTVSPLGGKSAPLFLLSVEDDGLPLGYYLPEAVDLDMDGNLEVPFNQLDAKHHFGRLAYLEFRPDGWKIELETPYTVIPRDVADVNRDEIPDLLIGAGRTSAIFTPTRETPLPFQVVWLDSSDLWAARFYDVNRDGLPDLLAKRGNEWKILENRDEFSFSERTSLPNKTEGMNTTGVPRVEIGDFDLDGFTELLFGDYDGDVYLYEVHPDFTARWEWEDRLPLQDAIDFLAAGDFDGDGKLEFAVACHSNPEIDLEHLYDNRHWLVRVYEYEGGQYRAVWEELFYEFHDPRRFSSSICAGDLDGDGDDELILHFYPNLYVVDFEQATGDYSVAGWIGPVRTSRAVVADLDRDGKMELLVSARDSGWLLEWQKGAMRPPELRARAFALDETRIRIEWEADVPADSFLIFRGISPDSLQPFAQCGPVSAYVDTSVAPHRTYWYRLQMDWQGQPVVSELSKATPHAPPHAAIERVVAANQLMVRFSSPMDMSVQNPLLYRLQSQNEPPTSAVLSEDRQHLLLSWPFQFTFQAKDTLLLGRVCDSTGTPVPEAGRVLPFEHEDEKKAGPYIVRAFFADEQHLVVEFSEPMDPATLTDPKKYRIEPGFEILQAEMAGQDSQAVILTFRAPLPVGPIGQQYDLYVSGVRSRDGRTLQEEVGRRITFLFVAERLKNVYVYPNPARKSLTFANLTAHATIEIFNLRGIRVAALDVRTYDGGYRWDIRDEQGNPLPSGVYLFRVSNEKESYWGKFAVVR